ncbi:hypothetical protein B0H19DRAFT_1103955 [Mycena capillaripes]|nr:hypothetical protein B0H19DRAFT_1103955 [Mycena capillaripes]
MKQATLFLVLAATSSQGLEINIAQTGSDISRTKRSDQGKDRARMRYARGCDEDDCEKNVHTSTKSQSSVPSKASNSTLSTGGELEYRYPQMHGTVVALACILSVILVTIAVSVFWRRSTRRSSRQYGPRPYLEIVEADADAQMVSIHVRESDGEVLDVDMTDVGSVDLLPPIQPFLRRGSALGSPRGYRAFADMHRKHPLVVEGGPTSDVQSDSGFDTPPPGYRSTETIVHTQIDFVAK